MARLHQQQQDPWDHDEWGQNTNTNISSLMVSQQAPHQQAPQQREWADEWDAPGTPLHSHAGNDSIIGTGAGPRQRAPPPTLAADVPWGLPSRTPDDVVLEIPAGSAAHSPQLDWQGGGGGGGSAPNTGPTPPRAAGRGLTSFDSIFVSAAEATRRRQAASAAAASAAATTTTSKQLFTEPSRDDDDSMWAGGSRGGKLDGVPWGGNQQGVELAAVETAHPATLQAQITAPVVARAVPMSRDEWQMARTYSVTNINDAATSTFKIDSRQKSMFSLLVVRWRMLTIATSVIIGVFIFCIIITLAAALSK